MKYLSYIYSKAFVYNFRYFRFQNVEVKNFTTSWNDGLAFCALLHNFVPDKIPFGDLTRKGKRENFEMAFGVAR